MPNVLVVYYSLEGTTRHVAESMAETTNADLLALRPRQEVPPQSLLKYPIGGFQALTKQKPALHPLERDPQDYDLLFVGTPVWAGQYTPAVRSFFAQTDLQDKAVALFCTHRGGLGRTLGAMRAELTGNRILGEQDFAQPIEKGEPQPAPWAREMLARYEDSAR